MKIPNLMDIDESGGRSIAGGQIGVNGYFYKGGQFLPNTMAEPGKWKLGKKWVFSGRELVGPGEWGFQPTPFSRSIFTLLAVGAYTRLNDDGTISLNKRSDGEPIFDNQGKPITLETRFRPGVKGVLSIEDFTLGELIDMYEKGACWIDVKPDAETITTATS